MTACLGMYQARSRIDTPSQTRDGTIHPRSRRWSTSPAIHHLHDVSQSFGSALCELTLWRVPSPTHKDSAESPVLQGSLVGLGFLRSLWALFLLRVCFRVCSDSGALCTRNVNKTRVGDTFRCRTASCQGHDTLGLVSTTRSTKMHMWDWHRTRAFLFEQPCWQ